MKPDTKITHGGPRPGAGRKILYDKKMVPVTIRLPPHYVDAFRELGGGNVSLGVRRLYEARGDRLLARAGRPGDF